MACHPSCWLGMRAYTAGFGVVAAVAGHPSDFLRRPGMRGQIGVQIHRRGFLRLPAEPEWHIQAGTWGLLLPLSGCRGPWEKRKKDKRKTP
jgi:hypothetical protein